MSRKILSFLVVLAMLVSSISFAFAADASTLTSGITDEKVKAAVGRLGALGMTQGLDDGTFGADQALNRAQAATFIVRALGLESAAVAAKGQATMFSDVAADNWAAGYISVAQGQGLVEGVGDGMFAPEAPFTYAQAVTILCRALGYKSEFLPGAWPGNYLAKAADLKITKNVTVTPSGIANRGAFAVMLSNTCDTNIVDVDKYTSTGIEYAEKGTLLEEKLEITKLEEVTFDKNHRLGAGEGAITLTGDIDNDEDTADATDDFDLASSSIDVESLLGQTVNVFVNDDNEVLFMEAAGSATIYMEYIDSLTDDGDVKLKYSSKIYEIDDDAVIFLNGVDGAAIASAQYGKVVVEGGKIVFADLYNGWSKKSYLVKSVSGNTITYYADNAGDEQTLNMSSTYPGGSIVKVEGKTATLADLKPYDVLYIKDINNANVDNKNTAMVFAFRKSVTGKVNGMKGSGTDTANIDVSGTAIEIGSNATYSVDGDATIKDLLTSAADVADEVDSMYGADATVYKDITNVIRHISTKSDTKSAEKFGYIQDLEESGTIGNPTYKAIIYTQDGDAVTYAFEDMDAIGYFDNGVTLTDGATATLLDGSNLETAVITDGYRYARFKLTKDGEIAENTLILKSADSAHQIDGKFGPTSFNDDAATDAQQVDSDAIVVMDVTENTGNDVTTAAADLTDDDSTVTNFKAAMAGQDEPSDDMFVVYFRDGEISEEGKVDLDGDVTGMFILQGSTTSDEEAAYVLAYFTRDDEDYVKIHRFGQSAAEELKVYDSVYLKESVVVAERKGNDKVDVTVAPSADFNIYGGVVAKISGSTIYISAQKDITSVTSLTYGDFVHKVTFDANTIVYSGSTVKTTGDIQVGDAIVAVADKDTGALKVVEWNPSESGTNTAAYVVNVTVSANGDVKVDADSTVAYELDNNANLAFDAVNSAYLVSKTGSSDEKLIGCTLTAGTHKAMIWKDADYNRVKSIIIVE